MGGGRREAESGAREMLFLVVFHKNHTHLFLNLIQY